MPKRSRGFDNWDVPDRPRKEMPFTKFTKPDMVEGTRFPPLDPEELCCEDPLTQPGGIERSLNDLAAFLDRHPIRGDEMWMSRQLAEELGYEVIDEADIERCGHDNDPGDRVCGECGAQLWSREDYEGEGDS